MLPYRYRSLEFDDSIRVLILHPSPNEADPIICSLQHVRLSDESLEYEGISYTWGDPTPQKTVFLHNGRRALRVGLSCYNVLCRLRRKTYDRTIWLDAVTIDQTNLKERSSQVRIMDRIFQEATSVTAYLGEETPGSSILFEELAKADKLLSASHGKSCNRPRPSNTIVRELDELFRRPWFTRVWVLQEVLMHESVTYMCGSATVSLQALRHCIYGYDDNYIVTQQDAPLVLRGKKLEDPSALSTSQSALWYFLHETRFFLATDPKDKVFALRSLLQLWRFEIDFLINYAQSDEEIFVETALYLLQALGLRMLSATRHSHEMDMSSWIPDWSQTLPLAFDAFTNDKGGPIDHREESKYFQNCKFQVRFTDEKYSRSHPELIATGCRYAQVIHRSETFSFSSIDDAKVQMTKMYNSFHKLKRLFNLDNFENHCEMHDKLGKQVYDAMSVLDGDTLDCSLLRYDGSIPKTQNSNTLDTERIRYFCESLQHARIVLMDNNELAIAAESVRIGDMVCVLLGTFHPCVLRRTHDGRFRLVSGDLFTFDLHYRSESFCYFLYDEYIKDNLERVEEFTII